MARILPLICIFASGAAGLVYEVVWIRKASLVFGATAPALGTVLAVFFGGLALGAWIGGRLAQRTSRPLRWYGALEIALAGVALAATGALGANDALYGTVYRALRSQPALLTIARPVLVALALLPPTIIMGATLPLLCRHFVATSRGIASEVGSLYALNTLGAVAGCAAAGFWLLPALGAWGSITVAAGLNLAAGVVMFATAAPRAEIAKQPAGSPPRPESARLGWLPSALFLMAGLVALAGEVLWTRFLALLVPSSIHTYTITLTVTLAGIVIGSFLASRLADRADRLATAFGLLLGGGSAAVLTLMFLPATFWQELGPGAGTFLALLLPPAACSGACLPVAVRLVLRDPDLAAAGVGRLLALNTAGGIAGALLASFVLLPHLGLAAAVRVITALGILSGVAALLLGQDSRGRLVRISLAAALAAAWVAVPVITATRLPNDFLAPRDVLAAWAEGQASTLAAVRRGDDLVLQIDRLWQGRREKNHQIMAAHVPMLLHPHPRRIALIGVGVGQTASRFLLYDVERVDCVDIEPRIFPFIRAYFDATWLDDPRVHAFADDGRTFIAHGDEHYDLISIEVGQTFRPGVEAFYTREFYARARARLAPGGLVAQFVPLPFLDETSLRRIVATFTGEFPRSVLWYNSAELLLIGGDSLRLDPARLAAIETNRALAADLAYSQWGGERYELRHLGAFLGGFLCGSPQLASLGAGQPPLTDDRPFLSYATAGARETQTREAPLAELLSRHLEPVATYLSGPVPAQVLADAAAVQALNVADISSAAHRRLGEQLRAGGDLAGAVDALRKALELNPQSVEVMRVLADVYLQAKRPDVAVSLFRSAVAARPGDLVTRRALGLALVHAGNLAEAEDIMRPVVAQRTRDTQAWNTLGAALAGQGKLDEAIGCFQRVLAIDPGDGAARQNLQRAQLDRGRRPPR